MPTACEDAAADFSKTATMRRLSRPCTASRSMKDGWRDMPLTAPAVHVQQRHLDALRSTWAAPSFIDWTVPKSRNERAA